MGKAHRAEIYRMEKISMRRYFIVAFVTLSLLILSNGCAGATPKPAATPAPVTKPVPTPTPPPAPAPSPKPAAEAPVISVNLDANVGTPPSEGWKWVVAEINTAAEEVKENSNAHGFFWSFFTVKGSHEVTMGSDIKMVQSGEAVLVQARQQHSHRYLPQSKVLVFDLRTVYDMPDSYHRGTQLPVPDNALDTKKGADLKLRVRTFVLAPGSRTSEALTSDPNFGYVMEGTLSLSVAGSVKSVEASKTFTLPVQGKQVASNEGTTPLRFILVDVR